VDWSGANRLVAVVLMAPPCDERARSLRLRDRGRRLARSDCACTPRWMGGVPTHWRVERRANGPGKEVRHGSCTCERCSARGAPAHPSADAAGGSRSATTRGHAAAARTSVDQRARGRLGRSALCAPLPRPRLSGRASNCFCEAWAAHRSKAVSTLPRGRAGFERVPLRSPRDKTALERRRRQ
jgi:hypothetical protein